MCLYTLHTDLLSSACLRTVRENEEEPAILSIWFEMGRGGLFFQVPPLTLGMCCFLQWEKLIPCLGWVG